MLAFFSKFMQSMLIDVFFKDRGGCQIWIIYCYVVNSYPMNYNRYRNRPNKSTMRIHVPFQDYIAYFESSVYTYQQASFEAG